MIGATAGEPARVRGRKAAQTGAQRPALTAEQKEARAMHLVLNDDFWEECIAYGSAYATGKERAGRMLIYLDALAIIEARRSLDLRFMVRQKVEDE